MEDDLHRQIRRLWLVNAASLLLLLIFAVAGWALLREARQPVDDLEVGRLTVVNETGMPALVIAGKGRLPGPTMEGREYSQELSGGRTEAAGMIFFNERGDEVGGLIFYGHVTEDGYRATGHLSFDQFRQDQVLALQYGDDGSRRSSGLNIWDRSTEVAIGELLELAEARRSATGAARDSLDGMIQQLVGSGLGTHRIFLGSQDRTATLNIQDTEGRTRIRLYVDSLDTPRLEFLDLEGSVILALPR